MAGVSEHGTPGFSPIMTGVLWLKPLFVLLFGPRPEGRG